MRHPNLTVTNPWSGKKVISSSPVTTTEMKDLLGGTLPLIRLPHLAGACFALCVQSREDQLLEEDGEVLGASIDSDGIARCEDAAIAAADGWARGTVSAWWEALSRGDFSQLQIGGAPDLVVPWLTCLTAELRVAESPLPEPALPTAS
jgi:hypothetical protein